MNFLLFLNRWRKEVLNEDPRENRGARRAYLRYVVGELILISYHMVVLDTVELPFKFPDLGAVCIHLLTRIGPIFVELVDDQHRVSVYHEAFDAELDGYTESVETRFILHGVVGGWKMNSENVSELVLGRRNE